MEAAANDVRDKVSQAARSLPEDLPAPPVVSKADASSDAIISMTVQSNTRNQLQITEYANNVLVERLQTIPGVSGIQIWGEKRYAMRIWFDPSKLSAYGLTPGDVGLRCKGRMLNCHPERFPEMLLSYLSAHSDGF